MAEFVEMMNKLFVPMFAVTLALQGAFVGAVLAGTNDMNANGGSGPRAAGMDMSLPPSLGATATREPGASIGVGASADAGRRPHCLTALPEAAGGSLTAAAESPRAGYPGRGRGRDIGSVAFERSSEQF